MTESAEGGGGGGCLAQTQDFDPGQRGFESQMKAKVNTVWMHFGKVHPQINSTDGYRHLG